MLATLLVLSVVFSSLNLNGLLLTGLFGLVIEDLLHSCFCYGVFMLCTIVLTPIVFSNTSTTL
jgi:hypothetical protein